MVLLFYFIHMTIQKLALASEIGLFMYFWCQNYANIRRIKKFCVFHFTQYAHVRPEKINYDIQFCIWCSTNFVHLSVHFSLSLSNVIDCNAWLNFHAEKLCRGTMTNTIDFFFQEIIILLAQTAHRLFNCYQGYNYYRTHLSDSIVNKLFNWMNLNR